MADAEMKTSHFPSIPFVASRDPTVARCRVRHVSIGTLETSCHRSDSRSRNSSDPFPELSPEKLTIQAAATLSALFWNFSHVVRLPYLWALLFH